MRSLICLVVCLMNGINSGQADEYEQVLRPLFEQTCIKCHGNQEANSEINFESINAGAHFLEHPELTQKIIDAVDTGAMPPDGETPLDIHTRAKVVKSLTTLLREVGSRPPQTTLPLQRLNRFQYNSTVRDLFQMNRNIFALPEKLMTRYDDYLQLQPSDGERRRLPDTVRVASKALDPEPGLAGVKPFPKDLHAEHGFDNQANQLTLSPLLLDAFLRLSVSIVESPDFNPETVGIWNQFFSEPINPTDRHLEVKQRLTRFLWKAFRGPVDDETINRYTAYVLAKLDQGIPFPDVMKKVAAAILSSPMFLYRSSNSRQEDRQFELASRLSYFLWGSCPDDELLERARQGALSRTDVLDRTLTRMLSDPKIERFLDTFPSQWMQLENTLAATPDPQLSKYFSLIPENPASLQMILEPLLLFDAVFVEDRPLVELIAPESIYQSDFLRAWYHSTLQPPAVDTNRIIAENQSKEDQRKAQQARLANLQSDLKELIEPVREHLLKARRLANQKSVPVDLRPFAAWDFNGDLKDSIGQLDLTGHGNPIFRDGMVILDQSYLISKPLPVDLKAKTFEVWCRLSSLDERGGGLMGIQGPGDFFDTIVIGERNNRHWISGSNGFSRTKDFPDSSEETSVQELLHLVMVYAEDGTTTLYRNGRPYGKPYQIPPAGFPRDQSSVIFGLRHLPPGGNKFLTVSIDRARLYDRPLTAQEVSAASQESGEFVTEQEIVAAMTSEQVSLREQLLASIVQAESALSQVPPDINPEQAVQAARQEFEESLRTQIRAREFKRLSNSDPRFGGVITNAAVLSMTSGPKRTHPVARGVWIIEVILNDPPAPPPNDVPPLNEETNDKSLTIREQFAAHRSNPSCAGCHTKLDPLGFAMENFDITGRWRERYDNGRDVDSSGTLFRQHPFENVVSFKDSLVSEKARFARAFSEHLLRFALARELLPSDRLAVDEILGRTSTRGFTIKSLIRELVASESFLQAEHVKAQTEVQP